MSGLFPWLGFLFIFFSIYTFLKIIWNIATRPRKYYSKDRLY